MAPATTLISESWVLYALGVCLILSRLVFRFKTLGSFRKLQLDDWMIVAALVPFTTTVVCANELADTDDLAQIQKLRFALEEVQIATNWLVKACLLILYRRIFPASTNRHERRYVVYASAYCLVSFLTIQALMPVWCHALPRYWDPSTSAQCTTYHNHSITVLVFSITTTLMVLIIPIVIIPTHRKPLLFALFLIGVFALVAGILGRYYVLTKPTSLTYLPWYIAETMLVIFFANLPFLTPIIISTTPTRLRHSISNLSLSTWPRSYKDTPPLRAQRERLSSTTTISTLSPPISPRSAKSAPRFQRLNSMTSTLYPLDTDDTWSDASPPPSIPPTPVLKLSLADPPPELEVYWASRRPSTRDTDVEKMSVEQDAQWPLR